MTHQSRWQGTLVLWAALFCCAAPVTAQEQLVVMDLPISGPLAASAQAVYDRLQAQSFDVCWLRQHEPDNQERTPAVLTFNTSAPLPTEQLAALPDFVRSGGGLVFIADGGALAANRQLLEPFGVKVYGASGEAAAVQIRNHPVAAGLEGFSLVRAELTFSSAGVDIVATQNGRPIAVAGKLGQGRFVVLLDNLVSLMADAAPDSAPVTLLTQAITWVAGQSGNNKIRLPGTETPSPDRPLTSPPAINDLAGVALVELGNETDRWPDIRRFVVGLLDDSGLQREMLAYEQDKRTLVQGLAGAPAVLVTGSIRAFSEDEHAAFNQYIWQGGSALILAYCTPRTVAQLQALNRLLAEVNLATTFGRPAGAVSLVPGPLTSGLADWKGAPAGVSVWALSDETLARVGGNTVLATHEFGQGRVVVADAALLLPPAKGADTGSATFRTLLARTLAWLVSPPARP